MKIKITLLIYLVFFLCPVLSIGQSLTYDDLIGLQGNSLEKAKGFFNYKGWTWTGTTKDCSNCLQSSGYDLIYDKTEWKNSNGESIQLLQKSGHPNAVSYYINQYSYNALENEVKNYLKPFGSGTEDNRLWNSYRGQGLQFTFNTKKIKEYYSEKTTYGLIISDENDLKNQRENLCSNCKGKGQITEYEKCSYCSGDGRQNCNNCRGKANLYCSYCQEGKVQCNSCYGRANINCNKCYGQGKLNCSKCYGSGTYNCSKCYGSGKINQNVPGYSFQVNCSNCGGKGKFTCENCGGDGSLRCENCVGIGTVACPKSITYGTTNPSGSQQNSGGCIGGKVNCSRCNGVYSSQCTNCNGSGNTDLVCSSCKGSGVTNREIKKVCSVCNGSKLKQTVAKVESEPIEEFYTNEEIFTMVDQMPEFPGGEQERLKFIQQNTRYPAEEKENRIEGTVYVSFIIDKQGNIKNIKVKRGVPGGAGLDKEALRVVSMMPKWKPGKQNGKEVLVQFYMPMRFQLK